MPVKFLVDFMLGKLAREIRLLGFDASYIQPQNLPNKNPLALINLAKADNRIILTRNTQLKDYAEVFFITSEKTNEQIKQVIKHFQLEKAINPFSRCLICNEVLMSVTKESVKGKVPFYIFQTKQEFASCLKCQKIYWAGTHRKDMQKRVKKINK